MKQAIDWIEDFIENEKLVIFTWHQETAQKLVDKFGKQAVKLVGGMTGKQREKAKDSFQNDENIRLFVGNVAAAGEGITLTAASNAAFIEHPQTPGGLKQGEDRIHRIGQEMPVTIWNLVGGDTIDEEFVQSLEAKKQVMSEVIDGEDISEESMFDEMIDKLYAQT
jgi:SNF2 family DNA or RNA helicase